MTRLSPMIHIRSFLAKAIIVFILAFSLPEAAHAAKIDAEGAAHLKKVFEDIITYQKSASELTKENRVLFQGDVVVEPADKYYAVTLPHISFLYPDGGRLELGIISINAVPHDREGEWKMTTALPTPIILFDKSGKPQIQCDIGSQLSVGIWNERVDYFTKLDARYQNVKIESTDGKIKAAVPEIEILYDLSEDEQGRWSGPIQTVMRGASIDFPVTGGAIAMKEAKMTVKMFSYIPQAVKDYKEKLVAMAEAGSDGKVSQQHVAGIYNMVTELLSSAGDGFTAQYEVTGLDVKHPAAKKDSGAQPAETALETLHFDKLSAGFDLTGFLKSQVKMALRFGFEGYKPPLTNRESTRRITPTKARLDIEFNNIPFQKIVALGGDSIAAKPGEDPTRMTSLAMQLPALLSESGTTIDFTNNHFGNDVYNITTDGKIKADNAAVNKVTADIQLRATGLDQLKADLAEEGDDPLNEKAAEFQKIAAQIQILQVMSEKKTDDKGNPLHVLNFVMDQTGAMLVNNQDIRMLFGAGPTGREKPPQASEPAPLAEGTAP